MGYYSHFPWKEISSRDLQKVEEHKKWCRMHWHRNKQTRKDLHSSSFGECESLRARIWLVVATRLQVWHSSFQLRTLSHMPSVLMNVAPESFCKFWGWVHFFSCNFCLKKRLDKLAQFNIRLQFGRAHQPVRANLWLSFAHKELRS
jgi:hypothetical protein